MSGTGISWAICKSAPCSRQITMPAPHHTVFYRPDALPAAKPTASKHWRQQHSIPHVRISHTVVLTWFTIPGWLSFTKVVVLSALFELKLHELQTYNSYFCELPLLTLTNPLAIILHSTDHIMALCRNVNASSYWFSRSNWKMQHFLYNAHGASWLKHK